MRPKRLSRIAGKIARAASTALRKFPSTISRYSSSVVPREAFHDERADRVNERVERPVVLHDSFERAFNGRDLVEKVDPRRGWRERRLARLPSRSHRAALTIGDRRRFEKPSHARAGAIPAARPPEAPVTSARRFNANRLPTLLALNRRRMRHLRCDAHRSPRRSKNPIHVL